MEFNDLTDEQKATMRACETPEDVLAFVKEEGIELTDSQLEEISGGTWTTKSKGCGE